MVHKKITCFVPMEHENSSNSTDQNTDPLSLTRVAGMPFRAKTCLKQVKISFFCVAAL